MTLIRSTSAALLAIVLLDTRPSAAQGAAAAPDEPAVTVRGQTYTPRSILARNMGSDEDQATAFPPHKVIGNVYYVGTRTLSAFLVTTPQGHILVNSTYERNVRTIERSVAQLGFKFADIRILLGTHAHGDHQEGDALLKELTGAQVMAMQEDVAALQAITPGGKVHPIDRVLHDGDKVTIGGHNPRRASDRWPHTRCHNVDHGSAGRRQVVQCGVCVELPRSRKGHE
ncbi:MAG: MBL fold metallo-hydrolase [Acidimicrobiia bacterium]|nr:MBL fold metallo-hydrolase [Acidimicrobiia bacterium]